MILGHNRFESFQRRNIFYTASTYIFQTKMAQATHLHQLLQPLRQKVNGWILFPSYIYFVLIEQLIH